MSQFIQRIANYVANEILIKGLANSRTFQRFAVRTDKNLQDIHKKGSEALNNVLDEAVVGQQVRASSTSTKAANASGPPQPPLTGFPGFLSAFVKEIRKDLGMGN